MNDNFEHEENYGFPVLGKDVRPSVTATSIQVFCWNSLPVPKTSEIFSKNNYRPRIQSVFYRAMMDRVVN